MRFVTCTWFSTQTGSELLLAFVAAEFVSSTKTMRVQGWAKVDAGQASERPGFTTAPLSNVAVTAALS